MIYTLILVKDKAYIKTPGDKIQEVERSDFWFKLGNKKLDYTECRRVLSANSLEEIHLAK